MNRKRGGKKKKFYVLQVVDNQNATSNSIIGGIPGIDILQYTVSGDYQLSVSALGISL